MVLDHKQLTLQSYPGYSYRYNGRHTLISALRTNNLFLDLPDILTRYHINQNLALQEIVRLDGSRRFPLIHREMIALTDVYTAAYASFDEDFQVFGPHMKHRVLNLGPAANRVPPLQFLATSPPTSSWWTASTTTTSMSLPPGYSF